MDFHQNTAKSVQYLTIVSSNWQLRVQTHNYQFEMTINFFSFFMVSLLYSIVFLKILWLDCSHRQPKMFLSHD